MFKDFHSKTFYFASLLLLTSCHFEKANNVSKKSLPVAKQIVYPRIIDSLKLKDFYDSAKWYIYTTHCDNLYLPKIDTSKSFTFGQLPLKFRNLFIKNDTLELHFSFTINNAIILPSMTRDFKEVLSGVGFNKTTKRKIYMWSPSGFTVWSKGGDDNRYEQPLQAKVLEYIIKNKDYLDNDFRILAEEKGIFK